MTNFLSAHIPFAIVFPVIEAACLRIAERASLGNKMNSVDNTRDLESHLSRNHRVLALFFSSWCPFCQEFIPSFNKSTNGRGFGEALHIQVDDYDNPLWDEYSIESVPTVILFEQGQVSKRLDGKLGQGLSEKQLNDWLRKL